MYSDPFYTASHCTRNDNTPEPEGLDFLLPQYTMNHLAGPGGNYNCNHRNDQLESIEEAIARVADSYRLLASLYNPRDINEFQYVNNK